MKLNYKLFFFLLISVVSFGQDPGWHLKDVEEDGSLGISASTLYTDILKNRKSNTVIVAVIDSGVDVEHEDLSNNIWINVDEIPDNGIDDDKNGYIDDINGWNFIGGPDGTNVVHDNYEATRLYKKYKYKYDKANPKLLSKNDKAEYDIYVRVRDDVEPKLQKNTEELELIESTMEAFEVGLNALKKALKDKKPTVENLSALDAEGDFILQIGIDIVLQQIAFGYEVDDIEAFKNMALEQLASDKEQVEKKAKYGYNPDFDPRHIVGDNYADSSERYYGNNDVEGPDALHGTHVAGIIGAVRDNDTGMDGVANNVRIMSVRAVPDGDERDKDVANAIRYAVDNGASIINMSFGKGFSWDEKIVEDAIKYAESKDVLLVHAAGNDGKDNDTSDNFPNDIYKTKGFLFFKGKEKDFKNWIEVGALSYEMNKYLAAPFSNYGDDQVDIFAPGMEIYSTVPDDGYKSLQGTSMAAPVVAGVASVLRSYFPSLTAEQVKYILMASSKKVNQDVVLPGTEDEMISFSQLSVSGGVVNAAAAVKLAMMTKGKKKIKKSSTNNKA